MQRKNAIGMHWSTYVGEFYNPDHDQIKKKSEECSIWWNKQKSDMQDFIKDKINS